MEAKLVDRILIKVVRLCVGRYLWISYGHISMITSERRSAIIKTVGLIAALTRSGMIDASIMPDLVRAAINPTVLMMAERLSDEIMDL